MINYLFFFSFIDQHTNPEELILGGILGRSSAKLPSSIRSGVNALKDTVQATKALQQLSSISLAKRTCWSVAPSTSTFSSCSNSISINKQRQKQTLDQPIKEVVDKPTSIDSSTYQRRKKDCIKNKESSTDSKATDYGTNTDIGLDETISDFSFPNQDTLTISHEGIMEVKRQMASVRHDIQKVSKMFKFFI